MLLFLRARSDSGAEAQQCRAVGSGPVVADTYDAIPKIELHCHVEGSVRSQTVLELAEKAGPPLAVESLVDASVHGLRR